MRKPINFDFMVIRDLAAITHNNNNNRDKIVKYC